MSAADVTSLAPPIERVLSASLGAGVRIATVERISEPERRNQLLRCRLAEANGHTALADLLRRRASAGVV